MQVNPRHPNQLIPAHPVTQPNETPTPSPHFPAGLVLSWCFLVKLVQQQAALMACGQTMATAYMNPMTAALSAAQVQQMNAVAAANGFTAGTTTMTPGASDFACKQKNPNPEKPHVYKTYSFVAAYFYELIRRDEMDCKMSKYIHYTV